MSWHLLINSWHLFLYIFTCNIFYHVLINKWWRYKKWLRTCWSWPGTYDVKKNDCPFSGISTQSTSFYYLSLTSFSMSSAKSQILTFKLCLERLLCVTRIQALKGQEDISFWSQTVKHKYLWLQEEQTSNFSATGFLHTHVYVCLYVCVCESIWGGVLLLRAENQREEKTIQAILSILSLGGSQRPAPLQRSPLLILSSSFLLFPPSSLYSFVFFFCVIHSMFPQTVRPLLASLSPCPHIVLAPGPSGGFDWSCLYLLRDFTACKRMQLLTVT